jgi:preprotein translocase subunit SecE
LKFLASGRFSAPPAGGVAGQAIDLEGSAAVTWGRRLDLSPVRQYIACTCSRPVLADIRRGFMKSPNKRAGFVAHPSDEDWAASACLDSRKSQSIRPAHGRGTSMAISPFKFLQEVRSETAKVTWPSRRETTITTIMVFVMVALASVFFFAADQIIRYLITLILGIH